MKKRIITVGFLLAIILVGILAYHNGYLDDLIGVFIVKEQRAENDVSDNNAGSTDASSGKTAKENGLYLIGQDETATIDYADKYSSYNLHFSYKIEEVEHSRDQYMDADELDLSLTEDMKQHMDEDMNFMDGYTYYTVKLQITNTREDAGTQRNNTFPFATRLYAVDETGNAVSTGEPYGFLVSGEKIMQLVLEQGQSAEVVYHFIIADKYEKQTLAIKLCEKKSPYDDPYIRIN